MALPSENDLIPVITAYLQACPNQEATARNVATELASRLELSPTDLSAKIGHSQRASGESAWRLTLRRCKFLMVRSGLVTSGLRGIWRLRS